MFQLIISILAIILAVALAGVSVYYGGSAFSNGSESASYAALTNQGAQIESAMTLYRAQKGTQAQTIEALKTENYLKQIPVADNVTNQWDLVDIDNDNVFEALVVTGLSAAICSVDDVQLEVNSNDTLDVEASFVGISGCTTTAEELTKSQSGVVAAESATIFYYNL